MSAQRCGCNSIAEVDGSMYVNHAPNCPENPYYKKPIQPKDTTMPDLSEKAFMELHASVHLNPSKLVLPRDHKAMEMIFICARDIVNAWPQTTIRTLSEMTKRMDTLRQALEAVGK